MIALLEYHRLHTHIVADEAAELFRRNFTKPLRLVISGLPPAFKRGLFSASS